LLYLYDECNMQSAAEAKTLFILLPEHTDNAHVVYAIIVIAQNMLVSS
jgi:hypothetical protein